MILFVPPPQADQPGPAAADARLHQPALDLLHGGQRPGQARAQWQDGTTLRRLGLAGHCGLEECEEEKRRRGLKCLLSDGIEVRIYLADPCRGSKGWKYHIKGGFWKSPMEAMRWHHLLSDVAPGCYILSQLD